MKFVMVSLVLTEETMAMLLRDRRLRKLSGAVRKGLTRGVGGGGGVFYV